MTDEKEKTMKFLGNTYDPKQPDARFQVVIMSRESIDDAWKSHIGWLADKIIGEPQPTEFYTVEQLKEMKMVGVYQKEA